MENKFEDLEDCIVVYYIFIHSRDIKRQNEHALEHGRIIQ